MLKKPTNSLVKYMLTHLSMRHLTGFSFICLKALNVAVWHQACSSALALFLLLLFPGGTWRSHSTLACCSFLLFFPPRKKKKKLLTFVLSTDDQSVCQRARIIHNQIQSWRGNKVNPLHDPATICVSVLVIGLLYASHYELLRPGISLTRMNATF